MKERIAWSGLQLRHDARGKPLKRFYQLETLASATERVLTRNELFLAKGLRSIFGKAKVANMSFELVRENTYKYVFRLRAVDVHGKRAALGYVVAKNSEECGKITEAEHAYLRLIHEGAPGWVAQAHEGGTVFMPDRHRRSTHHREVFAYLMDWRHGYAPVTALRGTQWELT